MGVTAPTILLFDIDGTLLHSRGAGRRALDRAIEDVIGISTATRGVDFRGMTDTGILRATFSALGMDHDPEQADRILARYVLLLEQELQQGDPTLVFPGVVPLLDWIRASLPECALGLGTGNVRPGAYAKLRSAGLDHHFKFGGFGCDHAERDRILRVGAERGAMKLNAQLDHCRVLVIGDTRRDVQAALAIGAECVAVGTGGIGLAELEASGATMAVETLEDPRVRQHLSGQTR